MLRISYFFLILLGGVAAFASSDHTPIPPQKEWSFNGMIGTFDRAAAQRGLQVFRQVCSSCHSLSQIRYMHLTKIGLTQEQAKVIASDYEVKDGPNDEGEFYTRPAKLSDRFVSPYPNKQAAQAVNGGAYPPDLSLITKARGAGADYLYALLTGYQEMPPKDIEMVEGKYYNPYFSGGQISMAPPLMADLVTYDDGTKASVEQMAHDVVTFLAWASEPELETRRQMGIQWLIILTLFTVICYLMKKSFWARLKKRK